MMKTSDAVAIAFITFLTTFVVTGMLFGCIGEQSGISIERRDAVRHGAAHWSIDPATGERIYVYGGK